MQWDNSPNAGFTTGSPFTPILQDYPTVNVADQLNKINSLYHSLRQMIEIRKKHPAFGRGTMEWINVENPAVAVYTRAYQGESLLIINNLSGSPQPISLPESLHGKYRDLFSGTRMQIYGPLDVSARHYHWLKRI